LGVRMLWARGIPARGVAAGNSRHRRDGDLRVRDFVERGVRCVGADGAQQDSDGVSADSVVRGTAAIATCWWAAADPAFGTLHLHSAPLFVRYLGSRQPMRGSR